MSKHKDAGYRCLVIHPNGEGQCIGCTCGEYHSPYEFRKLNAPNPKPKSNLEKK